MRFAFIVGCGHSGTTLLASRLGLHPEAWLVDGESYAFQPIRSARSCRKSVREWSSLAQRMGRSLILEKTPKHIQSIDRIRRLLPDARFIATARNPLDNIASMVKRSGSLSQSIERWNIDGVATARAVESGIAMLVRYEDLTRDTEATLRRATAHLGLSWDPSLLSDGRTAYRDAQNILSERMEQVKEPITDRGSRWREVLSEVQANEVLTKTAGVRGRLGYRYE